MKNKRSVPHFHLFKVTEPWTCTYRIRLSLFACAPPAASRAVDACLLNVDSLYSFEKRFQGNMNFTHLIGELSTVWVALLCTIFTSTYLRLLQQQQQLRVSVNPRAQSMLENNQFVRRASDRQRETFCTFFKWSHSKAG